MAEHEKDQLADMLNNMMNGEAPQDDHLDHPRESAEEPAEHAPAPVKPAPVLKPVVKVKPTAPARPVAPVTAVPRVVRPTAPAPAPTPPVAPIQQEEAIEDMPAEPELPPEESFEQAAEQTEEPTEEEYVAPPPVAPSAPKKRVAPGPKPHVVQTINFKRTIIPVLLTVAFLCLLTVCLGLISGSNSPFAVFCKIWFAIPVALIGLMLGGLGVVTMMQVKSELERMERQKQQWEA